MPVTAPAKASGEPSGAQSSGSGRAFATRGSSRRGHSAIVAEKRGGELLAAELHATEKKIWGRNCVSLPNGGVHRLRREFRGGVLFPCKPPLLIDYVYTGSAGGNGQIIITYTRRAVPEPASLTLLGTALLGLGVVYLRRVARRTAKPTAFDAGEQDGPALLTFRSHSSDEPKVTRRAA